MVVMSKYLEILCFKILLNYMINGMSIHKCKIFKLPGRDNNTQNKRMKKSIKGKVLFFCSIQLSSRALMHLGCRQAVSQVCYTCVSQLIQMDRKNHPKTNFHAFLDTRDILAVRRTGREIEIFGFRWGRIKLEMDNVSKFY